MTTANKLTLCRVVMIPIFLVLLYVDFYRPPVGSPGGVHPGQRHRLHRRLRGPALPSDYRLWQVHGPLADKLLVMSAMAWFVEVAWMPAWAFFVVIARELAVTGLRLVAVEQGRVIAAAKSGKVKTACTMVGIILMLIFPNATLRLVCVAVILVTTIYSGIEYFVKNKDVLAKGTM